MKSYSLKLWTEVIIAEYEAGDRAFYVGMWLSEAFFLYDEIMTIFS